ncbi:hypothetical protein SCYAM73S_08676 [Streptomyces cyaneofuscatus]
MALRITVIGTGYLGATHAAAMAELGFEVLGLDVVPEKIELLSTGRKVPMYEPRSGGPVCKRACRRDRRVPPAGSASPPPAPRPARSATSTSSV